MTAADARGWQVVKGVSFLVGGAMYGKLRPRPSVDSSRKLVATRMALTRPSQPRKTGPAKGKQQAENLSQTRREHANEITEDYVEAIADLSSEIGEARVVDLAKRLGVTHVTVNRTIARLRRGGYVISQPYRAIFLTDKGRELAAVCKSRHETVVAFLCSLGISRRVAEMDAEGIEHHVSPETLSAFETALRRLAGR